MRNCVIIDIDIYDSMVEELKEYNEKELENSRLIYELQIKDKEIITYDLKKNLVKFPPVRALFKFGL